MSRAISSIHLIIFIAATPLFANAADREFRPKTVIKRPFPAITRFPVATVQKAGNKIQDAELVLGVTVDGKSRAYPINMLTGPRREILNDTLGDKAIAATW